MKEIATVEEIPEDLKSIYRNFCSAYPKLKTRLCPVGYETNRLFLQRDDGILYVLERRTYTIEVNAEDKNGRPMKADVAFRDAA